jgi:glycosyltransferase involved in cell wall biosynthesis
MRPKVTVLSSLYNCEAFLPSFLKALTAIEGKDALEVLLLHNAPSVKELDVIQPFLSNNDFIKHIIIPERESLYRTWNRGINLSKGEYITVWNVDDIRFPDSIIKQAEALDNSPNAAIAYGDIWVSKKYGEKGNYCTNSPQFNDCPKEFLQSYFISCFQMWRKSIHSTIGYYDEQFRCSADFDFQIRAALHFPFVKTSEPLGIYLEDQPHKLSANGLQQLENNIIYLRYGAFHKINIFTISASIKKYRKIQILQFDEYKPLNYCFRNNAFQSVLKWILCILHSNFEQVNNKLFKLVYRTVFSS